MLLFNTHLLISFLFAEVIVTVLSVSLSFLFVAKIKRITYHYPSRKSISRNHMYYANTK